VCHSGELSIEEMVEKLKKVEDLKYNIYLSKHMEEQVYRVYSTGLISPVAP